MTSLNLSGGTITDVAGNNAKLILPEPDSFGKEIIIDTIPPEVTIISFESNNDNTDFATFGNTITLTFTTNEAIQQPNILFGDRVIESNDIRSDDNQ